MKWIYTSWITAIAATVGSLYFSEVKAFLPCNLCWYQRILMYPLVLLFMVASFKKDYTIYQYVLPLSITGSLFSLFHYLQQKTTLFETSVLKCSKGVPCSGEYINLFGFITIPFLAFIAFSFITMFMFLLMKEQKRGA